MVTKLTNEKWLNLYKSDNWIYASRKEYGSQKSDAVVVIGMKGDGLVVTKEYRHSIGDYEYSLPSGLIDSDETPLQAAGRELFEETGLEMGLVYYVSPPVLSSSGLTDESVVYVVCDCVGTIRGCSDQKEELIETEVYSLERLRRLRHSSIKMSAKLLPFIFMFEARGQITWE